MTHNYHDYNNKPRKHKNRYTHMQINNNYLLSKHAWNKAVSLSVHDQLHIVVYRQLAGYIFEPHAQGTAAEVGCYNDHHKNKTTQRK